MCLRIKHTCQSLLQQPSLASARSAILPVLLCTADASSASLRSPVEVLPMQRHCSLDSIAILQRLSLLTAECPGASSLDDSFHPGKGGTVPSTLL